MFLQNVALAVLFAVSPQQSPQAEATKKTIEAFEDRVKQYWKLHEKAESAAPPINEKKDDPHAIVAREHALSSAIRALRKNAKEGDIFTPAVRKLFVATIAHGLSPKQGTRGRTAKEMVLGDGNPRNPESKAQVKLAVNAKYPDHAPLSTVPPSVLLRLPQLQEGLEYRFVGRHLILFDLNANLIVDILRNAIR
jgi:hypothetical protein